MQQEIPIISVVIPMYNCEKYIIDCLDSLAKQSFKDFEVLVVNNASTDRSAELTEEFCKKDSRFHLLQCSDGMAGSVRNYGIDHTRGKYIAFVDGDDIVKEAYLEKLYAAIEEHQADVAVCGFLFHFLNTGKTVRGDCPKPGKCYGRDDALRELLKDRGMRFYLWNKLWRKDLFTDNNIRIPDMYYEDAVACTALFCHAEKVVTVDYYGYVYMRAFSKYTEVRMPPERVNDYIRSVALMRRSMQRAGIQKSVMNKLSVHTSHVFLALPSLVKQAGKKLKKGRAENTLNGWKTVLEYCRAEPEKLEGLTGEEVIVQ